MNPDDRRHAKPIPSNSIPRFRPPSVVAVVVKLIVMAAVVFGLAWGARHMGWLPDAWWPF